MSKFSEEFCCLCRKRTDPWVFKVSTTESVGDNRQCVTFVVKLNPSSGRDKNLQDVSIFMVTGAALYGHCVLLCSL